MKSAETAQSLADFRAKRQIRFSALAGRRPFSNIQSRRPISQYVRGAALGKKFEHERPFEDGISPFLPPNDEDVFVTRQKEEKSRKSMRMSSATARVYEKTTATTRAPLSRVRDSDISPKRQ